MAPKRLADKSAGSARKKQRTEPPEEKENSPQELVAADGAQVSRGGGRGLKAVQNAKELSTVAEGPDGSRTESKTSEKEQRIFTAKSNAHVETKVMKEQTKKTTRKDGTVVISEVKSSKKVCYL
mmetsp:Transcript_93471/g.166312  ORF Transcript_93471/g.166312 Transcript_93471/m.166312 type:complete len:124 (+) Transcript_93471:28-399(+)